MDWDISQMFGGGKIEKNICGWCDKKRFLTFSNPPLKSMIQKVTQEGHPGIDSSSTRKIALISSFEDWMNTCSREFFVSYAHQSLHPSPIKLTYPRWKYFYPITTWLFAKDRTENLVSLQIWDDFQKLVKLSKTKMKDLSNSTVNEAKTIGKRLDGSKKWIKKKKKKMEMPGFDPGTFRMLSGRDTNFATPPFLEKLKQRLNVFHFQIPLTRKEVFHFEAVKRASSKKWEECPSRRRMTGSRVAVGEVEGLSWSTSLGWWDQISWFTPQRFNLCWRTRGTTKLSKKREDLFESWKEKWETDWRKQQKKSNPWLLNQSPGASFGQQGGAMRYLSYSVQVSLCSFVQRTWVPCSMRPGGSCGATSINCGLTFSNSL